MTPLPVTFAATLWIYDGRAAWYFVSLPTALADEIAERTADRSTAFGSVRVEARIGGTTWATSLFPDTKSGTYVLPVKKSVRTAEDLVEGSPVTVHLVVRES